MTRTVRAKITVLCILTLGVTILLLGVAVELVGRKSLTNLIDSELRQRVGQILVWHRQMEAKFARSGGPSGPQGPPPNFKPPRFDPLRTIGPRVFGKVEGFSERPRFPGQGPSDPAYDPDALARAWTEQEVISTVQVEGESVRVISKADGPPGRASIVVQVPYPLGDFARAAQNVQQTLLVVVPIALLATGLASTLLVRRLLAPVREIVERTAAIGAPNLDERLPVIGEDEFSDLSVTINGMLGRLKDSFQTQEEALARLERILEQHRRFTADASHELRTPLSVIKANAAVLQAHSRHASEVPHLEAIDDATDRMAELVQGLMLLARTEAGIHESRQGPCDLVEVARNSVERLGPTTSDRIEIVADRPIVVHGARDMLERAIGNLLDNSLRHSGADLCKIEVRQEAGRALVVISDRGVGIAPEHVPHLFDRFYRVDGSRASDTGGTGLGLAIVKSIVEAHGGQVEVRSELGVGSTFTISIPAEESTDPSGLLQV